MKTITASLLLSCMVMSFRAQIPNYVPTSGLMGYWPFTGNANDITLNNYVSTIFGAVPTTDRFGIANRAYSFNGTSDYILTNFAGIMGAGSRAVSFWAKTTQGTTEMNCVSWGDNAKGNRFGCMFNYSSIGACVEGAYCAITYSTPAPFANGQWHHYVFQFSLPYLNQVQVYQDAVLLSQTTSVYNPTTALYTATGYSVTFGRLYVPGSPIFMNGQLDDIGIWNRTLTLCEIQQLYSSSLCVMIKDNGPEEKLILSPNPTGGKVELQGTDAYSGIEVFDGAGKLIYKTTSSPEKTTLDLSNFSNGVYLVKLTNTKGLNLRSKLIIMK
ncbi:MAG: T9SS type A sorting domain-containing protein [bacterium]|nr:T9SS type A sorting domain-containing protein [bacterium]